MQNNDPKAETTEFKGRRILVTGGTRGIGEAIVDRLIRGGGELIATARNAFLPGVGDWKTVWLLRDLLALSLLRRNSAQTGRRPGEDLLRAFLDTLFDRLCRSQSFTNATTLILLFALKLQRRHQTIKEVHFAR
jgi:hypothetical protein